MPSIHTSLCLCCLVRKGVVPHLLWMLMDQVQNLIFMGTIHLVDWALRCLLTAPRGLRNTRATEIYLLWSSTGCAEKVSLTHLQILQALLAQEVCHHQVSNVAEIAWKGWIQFQDTHHHLKPSVVVSLGRRTRIAIHVMSPLRRFWVHEQREEQIMQILLKVVNHHRLV